MALDIEQERQNAETFKNVNAVLNAQDDDFDYQDLDTDENPNNYSHNTMPMETVKSHYPIVNNDIL